MCQYSGKNGNPSGWHYKHLNNLCKSGAGLIMLESTAISNEGRITKNDLVLENNVQEKSMKKLFKYLKKNKIKLGLQISHAGKKGSANLPWEKNGSPLTKKEGAWKTLSSSRIKRSKNWPIPFEMTSGDMLKVLNDFKSAAIRAKKIGFDFLEIHMAHGYLLHQFYSPISNKRVDKYGGNLKNRCRYLLEIFNVVRKVWPKNRVLGARITGSDNLKNGSNINDAIYLTKELKKLQADYVAVSSGGIIPKTNINFFPGYNLKFANKIKKKVKILVIALGMLNSKSLINNILKKNYADIVAVSRRFIREPNWLKKNINKKQYFEQLKIPNQYKRCF